VSMRAGQEDIPGGKTGQGADLAADTVCLGDG